MRQGGSKCTSRGNILEASKDCKRQVFQQKAEEIREMQNVHTYIISRPLLPFFAGQWRSYGEISSDLYRV